MPDFKTIDDLGDLVGRRVLVRADLNVPMKDGRVTDDTRIRAIVPTVQKLRDKGAHIILMSHFGRPKGKMVPEMSLKPLIGPLQDSLGAPVSFCEDYSRTEAKDIILLENLRFHPGEEANDPEFAKSLADLGDFYVNDAFSAAHRAHASTEAIAHLLPSAAGLSMARELSALETALGNPKHPVCAVVGGAKVSSKLDVLHNLVKKVEHLIIGGGMANTFLAAQGIAVGKSLCEHDLTDVAKTILGEAKTAGCAIHLPNDVVLAKEFKPHAETRITGAGDVHADEMILDIGPEAVAALSHVLDQCRTLIWNGPLGAFETPPFDQATVALAKYAAKLTLDGNLTSIAGGGDTVAALNQAGVASAFTHVSTAGGAFLEWMEGRELPGVEALKKAR